MSCPYRVSIYNSNDYICGCPAGRHKLGHDCVDDRNKCATAKKQDKIFAKAERISQQIRAKFRLEGYMF